MAIFDKKKSKKEGVVIAKAPEEPETAGEEAYVEELSEGAETTVEKPVANQSGIQVREVPVCLSQAQINTLVIDNNIMLKQIISNMEN